MVIIIVQFSQVSHSVADHLGRHHPLFSTTFSKRYTYQSSKRVEMSSSPKDLSSVSPLREFECVLTRLQYMCGIIYRTYINLRDARAGTDAEISRYAYPCQHDL